MHVKVKEHFVYHRVFTPQEALKQTTLLKWQGTSVRRVWDLLTAFTSVTAMW